jgi:hypothetical protein
VEHIAAGRRKRAIRISLGIGAGIAIVLLILELPRPGWDHSLTGTVLMANTDPRKQLPVPNVEVTAEAGGTSARTKTDPSGFFRMPWRVPVWPGEQVTLTFRHPDYQPLEMTRSLTNQLYVARVESLASNKEMQADAGEIPIADIRVRYAVKATTTIDIGSTVKTFEVVNIGNIPCARHQTCSPDGRWKAAIGSIALDAGDGQEFQNVRISCIAGPCPFTKVDSDQLTRGGRKIQASVRAWSDTVTFLVEADVVRTQITDSIRQAFPSVFGRGMTFTLPPTGQGPSIEAQIDGAEIVFPLGPSLKLSWAACNLRVDSNGARLYSCELKPGYRFR